MESEEVLMARLVLGYLKRKTCMSAYKEFLRTSDHLQQDFGLAKSKYIPTRFIGLSLEDILSEYFEIHRIVQGRLEATNYYNNEYHSKDSLVQQLFYLLNKVQSSRASTPCPRSPADSHFGHTSPSNLDHISDVETTPAHTLPGNVEEGPFLQKTPRRKSKSSKSSALPVHEHSKKVLAQTLIENRKFHKDLAHTINKVAEKQFDKTVKNVVIETAADPMFDKILDEIIGSTNIIDNSKGTETSSTTSSTANQDNDDGLKTAHQNSESTEEVETSYNSHVEEQNNEAIRSIIASSNVPSNAQREKTETQPNNDIIVFEGSLDKYLMSSTSNANTQTQPMQNPLYISTTGGLLMVPNSVTTNVSGNIHIDPTNQFYLVNNQPAVNWGVPPLPQPKVLTEQDILSMPTVIVNDGRKTHGKKGSSLQTSTLAPITESQIIQSIAPKPILDIPACVGEYLTFHGKRETSTGLKKVLYPKKTSDATRTEQLKPANKTDIPKPNVESNSGLLPILSSDDVQDSETKKPRCSKRIADNTKAEVNNQKVTKPSSSKSELGARTPPPLEPVQKVTPKSGSHVRNLDFSTPPKITTHKKSMKAKHGNRTPPFVHKKQAAKTLFQSQEKKSVDKIEKKEIEQEAIDAENHEKRNAELSVWDADLRANLPADESNKTPNTNRNPPAKKTKRKLKTKKRSPQLNTTEQDAALLEAALQTPVKTEDKPNVAIVEDEIVQVDSSTPRSKRTNNKTKLVKKAERNLKKGKESKRNTTEKVEDSSCKTILSPSKLNASKRNMVNTDNIPRTNSIIQNSLINVKHVDEESKFITPETIKEIVAQPIKANRNILPMLETPIKGETIPKTPGLPSPLDFNTSVCSSVFTPFTKMLEANLKGVDINSIETPSIPITPNFPPFTPTVDLISPYSNRPTDYSTSSSYYQPSDTEQNKSLEVHVKTTEKNPITVLSNIVLEREEERGTLENNCSDNKPGSTPIREHLNIFNKNIIGKKNLSLMKRNISTSSSSSGGSTSDSSIDEEEDNDSSNNWTEKESNDTIIFKKKAADTPKSSYSLRTRKITVNKEVVPKKPAKAGEIKTERIVSKDVKVNVKEARRPNTKKTNKAEAETGRLNAEQEAETKLEPAKFAKRSEKVNTGTFKNEVPTTKAVSKRSGLAKSKFDSVQLRKELEEKRLRVINKFKNPEKTPVKKSAPHGGSFIKIKPISNITNSRKRSRKSDSPKKKRTIPIKPKTVDNIAIEMLKNSNECDNTDEDFSLHISESEEESEKSAISSVARDCIQLEPNKIDSSTSDVEAQNLIEGLKERGIHLMHNRSPMKKVNESFINSNTKNPDNIEVETKLDSTKSEDLAVLETSSLNKLESSLQKENGLSTSVIETDVRETYDIQVFEEEHECVVYDESKKITKTFSDYNTKILEKTFMGKVFIEEINMEVDIPLIFSQFFELIDIKPAEEGIDVTHKQPLHSTEVDKEIHFEKTINDKKLTDADKQSVEKVIKDTTIPSVPETSLQKSEDDLMNYASTGRCEKEELDGSESPKGAKKRKGSSDENFHTEKKCKTLLKQINVESFLNNIHGGRKK